MPRRGGASRFEVLESGRMGVHREHIGSGAVFMVAGTIALAVIASVLCALLIAGHRFDATELEGGAIGLLVAGGLVGVGWIDFVRRRVLFVEMSGFKLESRGKIIE